jgi:hypothetical protein
MGRLALPDLERLKPHNAQQSQPTRECHWGQARIFAYSNRNAFCFVSTTFPALAPLVVTAAAAVESIRSALEHFRLKIEKGLTDIARVR